MLLSASFAALVFTLAPQDDARKPANIEGDLKAMQGIWVAVSLVDPNGNAAPKDFIDTFRIVVKDDTLVMEGGAFSPPNAEPKYPKFRVKLDATANPKALDLDGLENVPTEGTMLATYELDGDSLKLCFPGGPGDPRPKAVEVSKEAKTGVFTLKRMK